MLFSKKVSVAGQMLIVACIYWGLANSVSLGQSQNSEHTLKLDSPQNRPKASLSDLHWLVGAWKGEAFGGKFEEVWAAPSAGSMMGMFKLIHNDTPSVFEFELIVAEDDSLIVKLKHFNAKLVGWEEKDKYVSFPLVRITPDAAFFDGLTYKRTSPTQIDVYIATEQDGQVKEEHLVFHASELKTAK